MLTDLMPEFLTNEEVLHYAELNEDPWVKRLLLIIHDLHIEREDSTHYDDYEEGEDDR